MQYRYLTLTAFGIGFAGDGEIFVPAFPAIYGGYYVGFGSVYNAADFDQPDVATARMAMTFVTGAQV